MKTTSDIHKMLLEAPRETLSIRGDYGTFIEHHETPRYKSTIITSKKLKDFNDEIANPPPIKKDFWMDGGHNRSVVTIRYDKWNDVLGVLAYDDMYGDTARSKGKKVYTKKTHGGLTISSKGYTKIKFRKRVLTKNGAKYINRTLVNYASLKNWKHLPIKDEFKADFMYLMLGKRWLYDRALLGDKSPRHIPISNKDARRCDTLKDVAMAVTGHNVSYRLIDRIGVPETYLLYRFVDHKEIPKISKFIYQDKFAFESAFNSLESYLSSTVNADTVNEQYILSDYLRQSIMLGEKVNLKASSFRRYKEEHDRQAVAIRLHQTPEFKTHKRFRNIFDKFDHPMELVDSKEEICKEGALMHHCVASYAGSINRGLTSIWRTTYDDNPYTVEVRAGNEGFCLSQVKGACNAPAPHKLVSALGAHLHNQDAPVIEYEADIEDEFVALPF